MMAAGCSHCGLPLPVGLSEFCCAGCEAVSQAIHELGLAAFYRMRSEPLPAPAAAATSTHEAFDDPSFRERHAQEVPGGLLATELSVEGMRCAACIWLVERVAASLDGVREIRADIGRSRARIVWDPTRAQLSQVARRLEGVGYTVHPYRAGASESIARREDRGLLIRLAVAGAVAGNVMLLAFALYGGQLHGMEPEYQRLFRWASLVVSLPSVIWGGGVFFRGAWSALRAGILHMDLPISIGILAGFGGGAVNTILERGDVYFDSVTTLIFLLLAGRLLQRRQQRRAADAASLLDSLRPRTARRVEGETCREVPAEALQPGDTIEVRAGEVLPADGDVALGQASLDLSLLTGESQPVSRAPGEQVFAGTVLLAGRVRVLVTEVGSRSRLGRLLELMEACSRRPARLLALTDRIAGWFVAVVLALAVITGLVWWQLEPASALDHVMAMLVITCPCALGLATPLALGAAMGRAARAGILVKGGAALENLSRPGLLWLDKTGTVTEGQLTLEGWWGCESAKAELVAVERECCHPLASALLRALPETAQVARDVEAVPGLGVRGQVAGLKVLVGSPAFVAAETGALPPAMEEQVRLWSGSSITCVVVAIDGRPVALAGLRDRPRADARATIDRIRAAGWQVGLLSGDDPRVVASVARELGIPSHLARGGVVPEEKLRVVESDISPGRVTVMVGDGVNDAAALAAADVGIAMHGGAEAALAAADVYIARSDLAALAELLDGSRRTAWVVRRNLLFSLGYNVVGATLALTGLVGPLVAAILMPVSSLTVIASSYRPAAAP